MKYLIVLVILLPSTLCLGMRKRKQPEPISNPVTFLQCKSLFKGKSATEFEEIDLECFLNGYINFFITANENVSKNVPQFTKSKRIIQHLGVSFPFYRLQKQIKLHLFFINSTEKNALLFLKYLLELNLRNFTSKSQKSEAISNYIYGTLVGISEDEIEKAYQLEGFIFRHADFLSTKVVDIWADLPLHKQDIWPKEVKPLFEVYKAKVWPKLRFEIFYPEKKEALEWFAQNKTVSLTELSKQIAKLLEQLNTEFAFK